MGGEEAPEKSEGRAVMVSARGEVVEMGSFLGWCIWPFVSEVMGTQEDEEEMVVVSARGEVEERRPL